MWISASTEKSSCMCHKIAMYIHRGVKFILWETCASGPSLSKQGNQDSSLLFFTLKLCPILPDIATSVEMESRLSLQPGICRHQLLQQQKQMAGARGEERRTGPHLGSPAFSSHTHGQLTGLPGVVLSSPNTLSQFQVPIAQIKDKKLVWGQWLCVDLSYLVGQPARLPESHKTQDCKPGDSKGCWLLGVGHRGVVREKNGLNNPAPGGGEGWEDNFRVWGLVSSIHHLPSM